MQAVDGAAVERALSSQPDPGHVKRMVGIFSAFSDPTRLRILLALSSGPLCVCDLAAVTGVSASAVSHQLRLLRDRDLVTYERAGRRAVYRLSDAHIATLLDQGSEHAGERP